MNGRANAPSKWGSPCSTLVDYCYREMWAQGCRSFLKKEKPEIQMFAGNPPISKCLHRVQVFSKMCASQTKHFYQAAYSLGSPMFNLWLEYLLTYVGALLTGELLGAPRLLQYPSTRQSRLQLGSIQMLVSIFNTYLLNTCCAPDTTKHSGKTRVSKNRHCSCPHTDYCLVGVNKPSSKDRRKRWVITSCAKHSQGKVPSVRRTCNKGALASRKASMSKWI